MKQVNLYEAKTRLSALVEEAAAGEEIVIAKNGKPLARLLAVPEPAVKSRRREFGQWGRLYPDWKVPNPFPEFTDEEIDEWENNPVFPDNRP